METINSPDQEEEEEEEEERRKLGQSQSEPELTSTGVVAGGQNSQITPEVGGRSQSENVRGWTLELLYSLIYETSKIIYFIIKVS